MEDNYLAKWLNNELSEAELETFKKTDEYATYVKIANASKKMEAPNFNEELAWNSVKNITEKPKVIQLKPFRKFLRVAAVIAFLLVGSYFYVNTLDKNVATEYAQNKEVVLPDNSEIVLNAESRVSFNEKKWDEKRNISLQGEAYFKVAKGKRFTVSTSQGEVAVLGTQFNVENRGDYFEVTCFEGLVSVTFNGKEIKLPAGNSFLAMNGTIIAKETTKEISPAWLNNESSFKSIPLKYVLDEFQRQHNITVETKNIDLNKLFTGTFSNTNTDLALQSISVPSQIKFKLDGNKVLFYAQNAPQ